MEEQYAELQLYSGSCTDAIGCGSGKLILDKNSPEAQERYRMAMKVAMRAVYSQTDGSPPHPIRYDPYNCVPNEQSASAVIDYAERNIPGSHGSIELYDIFHGMVRFRRKVRFPHFTSDRKKELIRKICKSGQKFDRKTLEEKLAFL